MMASLAEQVPDVLSTVTRFRPSVGSGVPARTGLGDSKPYAVERNGIGSSAGVLLLTWARSNTLPAVFAGPAIM